ncbi:MAG: hypothetical protein ACREMY_00620 [bacterium]
MPELSDCNPPPEPIPASFFAPVPSASSPPPPGAPPEDDPPQLPAAPPVVEPHRWEDFAVFRESFMVYVSPVEYNASLRMTGKLLYEMMIATWGDWPDPAEGWLRAHLRAAVADLRQLQGSLTTLGEDAPDDPYEAALCRTALLVSAKLGKAADSIEGKLGTWRGEEEPS